MKFVKILLFICFASVVNGGKRFSDNVLFEKLHSAIQKKKWIDNNSVSDNYDNEMCISHLLQYFNALSKLEFWALKVADAWGKIPSGILKGNIIELGSFDQCVDIFRESSDVDVAFKGQYCLAMLNILELIPIKNSYNITNVFDRSRNLEHAITKAADGQTILGPILGICIPNTCSASFITEIINENLDTPLVTVVDNLCQQKEDITYSGLDIFAICFFSLIMGLMIASTIYDIFVTFQNKEPNKNLIAFSMYTNGGKIFKCNRSKSADILDCLNGIRALSIIWVVFGHSYQTKLLTANINLLDLMRWFEKVHSTIVLGATVAVDSFFLLGGLLVTWSVLKQLDKSNGRINIFLMYFHRYIRLTPALAAGILFYVTLANYLVDGPLRNVMEMNGDCKTWWWSALLYVQNYVNVDSVCLIHSWYLSIDMQLFILSPLIIYPFWRWRNKFIWIIPILIVLSMACVFTIFMNYGFTAANLDPQSRLRNEKTYKPTHTRYGVYLIGILLGYFLHNLRGKKINLSKPIILFGWILSLATILSVILCYNVFQQRSNPPSILESAFYESFSRIGWGIALSWIIFACIHGFGGPINWFLSLPQWQPISRLSYSLYIVHLPIQYMFGASVKTGLYFSDITTIRAFWGDLGIALTVALFWSMAFELPVLTLEKLLLGSRKKIKPPVETNKQNSEEMDEKV